MLVGIGGNEACASARENLLHRGPVAASHDQKAYAQLVQSL